MLSQESPRFLISEEIPVISVRGRDQNYCCDSASSAVAPPPAVVIVPSLDSQRQRLASFITTLTSFTYVKNESVETKAFPLFTIHNI